MIAKRCVSGLLTPNTAISMSGRDATVVVARDIVISRGSIRGMVGLTWPFRQGEHTFQRKQDVEIRREYSRMDVQSSGNRLVDRRNQGVCSVRLRRFSVLQVTCTAPYPGEGMTAPVLRQHSELAAILP